MNERILSCPVPQNINPLSPNGYLFSIQKLPSISYFAQSVSLPLITLTEADVTTPFVTVPVPGDRPEFSAFSIQFLIDEKMENYKAVHNWITGLGFPDNYEQYTNFIGNDAVNNSEYSKNTSDATLIVLGNNNLPIQTIKFFDCWPDSLGSITFTSNNQDVQYLVGEASFRYTHYLFQD